jgi:hypothetical protein
MALQPNSGPGLPFSGFLTITFLQGWIVSPGPNLQPGGPGLRIYDPRRQGGPAIHPRHWVHIFVAFYDMHGLQWDYSLIPATTRESIMLLSIIISRFDPRQRQEIFTSNLCVQTGSGALSASCPLGTGGPFPGGKSAVGT